MRKLFLLTVIIFFALLGMGCREIDNETANKRNFLPVLSDDDLFLVTNRINVITVDGCEYIVYRGYSIIHKANCSNPAHNGGE